MLRLGKRLIFVTNNSTKSRAGYLKKFLGLGLEITAEEVLLLLRRRRVSRLQELPKDKKVYVTARRHLGADERRHRAPGREADADKTVTLASGQLMEHDKDVAAVVVGFDRNVNYKIQYATLCIRENPGCGSSPPTRTPSRT